MKPTNLRTRVFLDSGSAGDTRRAVELLGFLDGQTTNPSLVAKSLQATLEGRLLTPGELRVAYHQMVREIAAVIPDGHVSIEVYADATTTAEQMLRDGHDLATWTPRMHIKYPTTPAGLEAAQQSTGAGYNVNMTLCFSQSQAAAVYSATLGATRGQVLLSPFVGRLDDTGVSGLSLIADIQKMYAQGDGHVEVLAASIRTLEQFLAVLALGVNVVTVPLSVLEVWAAAGMPVPTLTHEIHDTFTEIPYHEIPLTLDMKTYPTEHPLTTKGVEKFAADWNALVVK